MKIFALILSFYFCYGITCREFECIKTGNCTFGYGTGPTKGFFRNLKAGYSRKKQFTQERQKIKFYQSNLFLELSSLISINFSIFCQ
jgi:hypothetical protein